MAHNILLGQTTLVSMIKFGALGAQVSLHLPATVVTEANVEPGAVIFKIRKSALSPALGGVLLGGAVRRALILAPAADGVKAAAVGAKVFLRAALSRRTTQIKRGAIVRIARVLS